TDTSSDNENCGECGHACLIGTHCVIGNCEPILPTDDCDAPKILCGHTCTDTSSDYENCGKCGNRCLTGTLCIDSECVGQGNPTICTEDFPILCGETCVNIESDANHCGKCDNPCKDTEYCNHKSCELYCPNGLSACGESCFNLQTDIEHCGKCDIACNANQTCQNGACTDICRPNETFCPDKEICADLNTSSENCGKCGHICAKSEVCLNGNCMKACENKTINCNGDCIDPLTNAAFCGAKGACSDASPESEHFQGVKCASDEHCQNGICTCIEKNQVKCLVSAEQDAYEYACIDPSSSPEHCGCNEESPGLTCAELPNVSDGKCNKGTCEFTCKPGFADCDGDPSNGCEADLSSPQTCGTCKHACDPANVAENGLICTEGKCTPICKDGFIACNGKCISPTSDDNCGACGNVCPKGLSCSQNGICQLKKCTLDNGTYASINIGSKRSVRAYCIQDIEAFEQVRDAINQNRRYPKDNTDNAYILVKDINLYNQVEWKPIGSPRAPFSGIFFGNGHTISGNLICNQSDCGLFGNTQYARIDGLHASVNITFKNDASNIGAIIGRATNTKLASSQVSGSVSGHRFVGGAIGYARESTLTAVKSSANVTGSAENTGGLIGGADKSYMIDCQVNQATISGVHHVGGIAGSLIQNSSVRSSSANKCTLSNLGNKTGGIAANASDSNFENTHVLDMTLKSTGEDSGLFAGYAYSSKFSHCAVHGGSLVANGKNNGGFTGHSQYSIYSHASANGTISTKTNAAGGLVGKSSYDQFTHCTTKGSVSGDTDVGGLIGHSAEPKVFSNSRSESNVTALGKHAGGLIGYLTKGTLQTASAAGSVTGKDIVGGLIGFLESSTLEDSHAAGHVTGSPDYQQGDTSCGGLVGYATSATINDSSATGNATCTSNAGGFIGATNAFSRVTLQRCAAFGNAKLSSGGASAGGFIGMVGRTDISQCTAYGDAYGDSNIGAIAGLVSGTFRVYSSVFGGTSTGIANTGALIGYTLSRTTTLSNTYYWDGNKINKIVGQGGLASDSSYFKSTYFHQEARLAASPTDRLIDALNASSPKSWTTVKCKFDESGPKDGKEYAIVVPKGILPAHSMGILPAHCKASN
ncbi:MAG: hypothetical protein IJ268_07520, partial [Proteobacteria bacterium]|nr:hypothetical protein [Pseudomonadota bacterium]